MNENYLNGIPLTELRQPRDGDMHDDERLDILNMMALISGNERFLLHALRHGDIGAAKLILASMGGADWDSTPAKTWETVLAESDDA